jgi:hypothetical protein
MVASFCIDKEECMSESTNPARVALLEHIENDFTYHAPTDAQVLKYTQLREDGKALARLIVNLTPPSREQSLALTHLEEAIMQANAAIARHPEE